MVHRLFSWLMILIAAVNITFSSIGSSLAQSEASMSCVQTEKDTGGRHCALASCDDPFQHEEDRHCPSEQHESCHTCHLGHCVFTVLIAGMDLGILDEIGRSIGATLSPHLDIDLSAPRKPPRAAAA